MILIALVAGVAAAAAFASRDLGSPRCWVACSIPTDHLRAVTQPVWLVRVLRGLYERRLGLVAWAAGLPPGARFWCP